MIKSQYKPSKIGLDGAKNKRSCESLAVCQSDGRCDDCPLIG